MYMTIVFVLILAVCEASTTTDPPETPGTYSVCHLILVGGGVHKGERVYGTQLAMKYI